MGGGAEEEEMGAEEEKRQAVPRSFKIKTAGRKGNRLWGYMGWGADVCKLLPGSQI